MIDPLLTLLEKVPEVDSKCFADDLAVGFRTWHSVKPIFSIIDSFSDASGVRVNFSKTKFLTTAVFNYLP